MTKDEALRLALEVLADLGMKHYENTGEVLYKNTYTAIKAALEAKDEPVAWMRDDSVTADTIWGKYGPKKVFDSDMPLYTTPPQRKPLTDDEIQDALEAEFLGCDTKRNWQDDLRVARAIEAAHGIKGEA
ncbi:MAG: hypothetical protein EBW87_00380 [Burkholderiaceae bacterium]|nr:hypothetical protein [Burkholderiaceae bacterium]